MVDGQLTRRKLLTSIGAAGVGVGVLSSKRVSALSRDRLADQLDNAYSNPITGQQFNITTISNARCRTRFVRRVQQRSPHSRWLLLLWHKPLLHSTRRSPPHMAPFELGSPAYTADKTGSGALVRDFAAETDVETMPIPDAAPSYDRPATVADGGATIGEPEHVKTDRTLTRHHPDHRRCNDPAARRTACRGNGRRYLCVYRHILE